jgi:3-phosphoshikimate 1-carboxyvinyltransferase
MTLWWGDRLGIRYEAGEALRHFHFPGAQAIPGFQEAIPGDYSSASFPAVAAAITGGRVHLGGLKADDPQGDAAVIGHLGDQGCDVTPCDDRITVSGPRDGRLQGGRIDCNDIPDALPALAVAGCVCREPLSLVNVAHARAKETDRVAVMAEELGRLGVRCEEHPDGLTVYPRPDGRVSSGSVRSHGDHRVAMALSVAGLIADGPVEVDGAEAADITYPGFYPMLDGLRA